MLAARKVAYETNAPGLLNPNDILLEITFYKGRLPEIHVDNECVLLH